MYDVLGNILLEIDTDVLFLKWTDKELKFKMSGAVHEKVQ